MKNVLSLLMVCVVVFSFAVAGCGVKKAESSSAAINASKAMSTTPEKVSYLIDQAKAFYSSKNFQEAVNIAQYVLNNIDNNSLDAKNLIEKAKAELAKAGQQKLDEMKNKLGTFGSK